MSFICFSLRRRCFFLLFFFFFLLLLSCFIGFYLLVLIWFVLIVETFLCMPPADGFVLASLSALLATAILIPICYCNSFLVGVWEGLRGLSRFVPLLVPPFAAFTGGQFSWLLSQEFIGHTFPFNFCLLAPSRLFQSLLLGCPTLFFLCLFL
jgi:hypothetical protein